MSPIITPFHADDFRRGNPPVLCKNCGEEIMAVGLVANLGLAVGYEWAHVSDGYELCRVRSPKARPYDDYAAERQLKAGVQP